MGKQPAKSETPITVRPTLREGKPRAQPVVGVIMKTLEDDIGSAVKFRAAASFVGHAAEPRAI